MSARLLREGLSLMVLLFCTYAVAWADEIPSCRLPPHAESVLLISNAPETLRDAIQADIGDLANPGEDFNATDVVEDGRLSKRLIFIWHSAELWIVATESGGIAYNDPIYAYRLKQGKVILLETKIAFPNTVCTTANRLWTNQRPLIRPQQKIAVVPKVCPNLTGGIRIGQSIPAKLQFSGVLLTKRLCSDSFPAACPDIVERL